MSAANKLTNSAHQLGVMLGIPMYVDPEKGFTAEKIVTWENGDKIKIVVNWADGAFYYTAFIGQIDPKTNEMSFISGNIAEANSLESLIGMIDGFLKEKAIERGNVEQVLEPEVSEPESVEPENYEDKYVDEYISDEEVPLILDTIPAVAVVNDLPAETEVDPVDQILADYRKTYASYESLLLDPEHDHAKVFEMSNELAALEIKLREQGINPKLIEK